MSLVAQVVDLKVRSNYDRSHGGIAVESEKEALSLHSNSLSYFTLKQQPFYSVIIIVCKI